jgi:formylglycine-generating enzyme required for sulfatase activity
MRMNSIMCAVLVVLSGICAGLSGCSGKENADSASPKAMLSFSISSPSLNGTVNESSKTVAVYAPYGTSRSSLIAVFSTSGVKATVNGVEQASGVTVNNFNGPVIYKIYGADGSTAEYTVTVPIVVSISTAGTGVESKTTYTMPSGVIFSTLEAVTTAGSGITFPMGMSDSSTGTITSPFVIGETDITYELWSTVYTWAASHGYSFGNAGQNGTDGTNGNAGFNTASSMQYPVTRISWRDAIVWCNALTEYYNANRGDNPALDCVYYSDSSYSIPLRTSTTSATITYTTAGSQDFPYIKASVSANTDMAKCTAKGFRLPLSTEHEYAARYRGTNSTNTVAGYANPYYTKGNSASGATADYTDATATGSVAVYGLSMTFVVKSRTVNALNLYDMSGNIQRWCFDWYPGSIGTSRVLRGGNYSDFASYMSVSVELGGIPSGYSIPFHVGLRIARTK